MNNPAIPTVRDFMAKDLITVRPELSAMAAARILLEHNISGAPVVDEAGNLIGVLSEFDCIREVASRQYHKDPVCEFTVGEVMTKECETVSPDSDVYSVAQKMVTHRVRRLPVVQEDRVLGQVSRRDVFHALFKFLAKTEPTRGGYPDYPKGREPIQNYPKAR